MDIVLLMYCLNAMLLLLHEIESAYWKEWELFSLKGGVAGFVALHAPLILLIFWGLLEVRDRTSAGFILALLLGVGGTIPFIVHRLARRVEDRFNLPLSVILIVSNLAAGIILVATTLLGW